MQLEKSMSYLIDIRERPALSWIEMGEEGIGGWEQGVEGTGRGGCGGDCNQDVK